MQECVEQKILARGHILDNLGGNTMRLKEHITHMVIVTVQDLKCDYELYEDTVQIVYNTTTAHTSIKFDEISNSQALGDLSLSNKAGKVITQRFKLDSGHVPTSYPLVCILGYLTSLIGTLKQL